MKLWCYLHLLALNIWQYLRRNVLFLGDCKQVNEDFFSLCNFSCLPWSTASRQKPHAFIPTFIELRYYQGCNWQRKSLISFEPNVTKQWRILYEYCGKKTWFDQFRVSFKWRAKFSQHFVGRSAVRISEVCCLFQMKYELFLNQTALILIYFHRASIVFWTLLLKKWKG